MATTTTTTTTAPHYSLEPENLLQWIETNKHRLAPPVCNALLHTQQLKTMIVGGPNTRSDYHVNPTDEWFYQLKGPMVLRIKDTISNDEKNHNNHNGVNWIEKDIPILEGEMFLLPPNIPHSPQRFENTIGLVMETQRPQQYLDRLSYYCPKCENVNFTDAFECTDLGTQLIPFIKEYYSNEARRHCGKCGHDDEKPTTPAKVPDQVSITPGGCVGNIAPVPVDIDAWVGVANDVDNEKKYLGNSLGVTKISFESKENNTTGSFNGERWIYSLSGTVNVVLYNHNNVNNANKSVKLQKHECILLPPFMTHSVGVDEAGSSGVICTFVDLDLVKSDEQKQ